MPFNKPFRAVPIHLGERYRAKRRKERMRRIGLPVAVISAAAAVGALVGVYPALIPADASGSATVVYDEPLSGCTVTDGDTIRCGDERIRLLGIDTPELPGHCRRGRDCVTGDPYAATASLEAALAGSLTINRVGEDRYGRTLARVAGAKGDLSCWQLASSHAVYKAEWDDGWRVARTCPKSIF